ncbi:MAG TPA: twin-arginine translocase TatA/TatE family subunit [Thermomicrobiales bacterium]|jgi:sec-independent protein translocase protein TatA|nr:twin-arginine translocase TatA/TatE family subunit [Thermomicrobiales bacterium]
MPSLGWQELLLILVIVIIIFGVGKLPEIGGAMGKGIKEFRANATDDDNSADKSDVNTNKPIKEEL